jgi:hypothetical protein
MTAELKNKNKQLINKRLEYLEGLKSLDSGWTGATPCLGEGAKPCHKSINSLKQLLKDIRDSNHVESNFKLVMGPTLNAAGVTLEVFINDLHLISNYYGCSNSSLSVLTTNNEVLFDELPFKEHSQLNKKIIKYFI